MFKSIRKSKNGRPNRGAVTVEFALVAPLFLLIIFFSIEYARVHMVLSAVENACFEGARRGIVPGATSSACQTKAENLLELAGLRDFSIQVEPRTIAETTKSVVVTATVPLSADNGFGISGLFPGKSVVREISMRRQKNVGSSFNDDNPPFITN